MQDNISVFPSRKPSGPARAPRHNLPAYLTPLIGREQTVQAGCALLRRAEVRLVTLIGTGGVGKTRLGLQIALDLLEDFADGVCFVSLAPIGEPDLVVPSIAQALGLKESGDRSFLEEVQASLQDRHLLLLLDNFEQVVVAAPRLADLLGCCTELKILVTSRAVLRIQGEHEFPVPPLAVPDLQHLPETDVLEQNPAVMLFLQRARASQPDFQLTKANARPLAEICARLDGLPLAIELAAARLKVLPPQALLTQLHHRLQLLAGGARDVPARQQTLRNTLAWSYDLLDAAEQRLFRRLSVFVGSCTLEAVKAVCTALGDAAGLVVDGMASLIDNSLVQQTEQEGEEPRFVMLETIREYGLESLATSGEMEATRYAHAAYYLALAEQGEREPGGPQQLVWLERMEQEYDNLRAVMEWSLESAKAGLDLEMALRLCVALEKFWDVRGLYSEARAFLEQALGSSVGVAASLRARALSAAAGFASAQSDFDRAKALYRESLVLYRELGETRGIAFSLFRLAWIEKGSDAESTRAQLEESLALFRELGDKEDIALLLHYLADAISSYGEYSEGRALFEESLAIYKELGNKRGIADSLSQSALWLFFARGDQATLRTRLEESLVLFRELGDKTGMAFYFWTSGWIAFSQGDTVTAYTLVEQGLALMLEMGDRWHAVIMMAFLGRIKARQGDFTAARLLLDESLAEAITLHDNFPIAFCLEGLAGVMMAQGKGAWAARLWGAAELLRERKGIPLTPAERVDYEPAVADALTQLGKQAFTHAWAEGRTMSLEQLLAGPESVTFASPIVREQPTAITLKPSSTYPDGLTAREVDVLRLVAQGLADVQIAEQLIISPRTVNSHLTSIYSKIQVSSRAAATRYAMEHQLV